MSSSLCDVNRQGFGQLERVQLTSHSINIQFKNIFYNFKCSSIYIYALITNIHTNKLERTIEVLKNLTKSFSSLFFHRIFKLILSILISYFLIIIIQSQ
jgi:hypothetical protein